VGVLGGGGRLRVRRHDRVVVAHVVRGKLG